MLRNKSVMLILHPIFPASKKIISTKLTCGFKSLKTGTSFTHTLSLSILKIHVCKPRNLPDFYK